MTNVNHEILIWAREMSGLSVEEAARKLQLRDSKTATAEEKLLSYEQGKAPSRPLILRMSKQYRVPLLSFYLSAPPVKEDRGEDFRTLPEAIEPRENSLVDSLVRDIKARQSILRDTLRDEEDSEPLTFVGSMSLESGITEVANSIVSSLNFSLDEFRSYRRTAEEAFKYLRERVEANGIFTLLVGNLGSHHSNLDTTLFRGFVLADNIAPMIIINDQDAKSAWSFTLFHELAHLWLGQTGVSGTFSENVMEKFCNDVASEILLPSSELNEFNPSSEDFSFLSESISEFASRRNLSSGLVSYRLFRAGRIDEETWQNLSAHYKNLWLKEKAKAKAKNRQQEGGPNYFVVRRSKLGNALLKFTQRMMFSGALSATEAGFLLGVKPLKVHKLIDMR